MNTASNKNNNKRSLIKQGMSVQRKESALKTDSYTFSFEILTMQ